MIKNETHIDALKVRKPYVAPQIEVDVYQSEAGFAASEAWNAETTSLLTDADGDVDAEAAGWIEGDHVIY